MIDRNLPYRFLRGQPLNKIDEFFFSLLPQVSVLLTAAISVDRLLALLHVRAEI